MKQNVSVTKDKKCLKQTVFFKYKDIIYSVVLFIAIYLLLKFNCKQELIFDSAKYWKLSDPCFENDQFNLLNFPETFRGYFLPVFYGLMRRYSFKIFGSEWILYLLTTSIMLTLLISTIIPKVISNKLSSKRKFLGGVVFLFLIWYFFKDLYLFPLSDLQAMFFVMGAFVLLENIKQEGKNKNTLYFLKSILAGAMLYIAYNTRTIYLYGIILFLLVYLYRTFKDKYKKAVLLCIGVSIGALSLALPQMIINNKYTGSFTPRVLTEQRANYEYDLNSWQMYQGIRLARYESYSGEEIGNQKKGGLRFFDNAGKQLLISENLKDGYLTISDFFKLLAKHPFDMIGIYIRSLVNYMTPLYTDTYISDLYKDKMSPFFINAVIWIISFGYFFMQKKEDIIKWSKESSSIIISTILPCLLLIVGAPEIRFFLPIYYLLYGTVCYSVDYKGMIRAFKANPIKISIIILTLFCLWIAVIGSTLSQSSANVYLFN